MAEKTNTTTLVLLGALALGVGYILLKRSSAPVVPVSSDPLANLPDPYTAFSKFFETSGLPSPQKALDAVTGQFETGIHNLLDGTLFGNGPDKTSSNTVTVPTGTASAPQTHAASTPHSWR